MGERWLPYAAAALATGASALIMGALSLPSSPSVLELVSTEEASPERWLLASAAFMYAAFALTLGIPTFIHLLKGRGRVTGQVGAVVFAFGTIGTAGYAALLILFRALAVHSVADTQEFDLLSRDTGLIVYLGSFLLAFQAGLLVLGVALLMAGTVARWIPVVMIGHAVTSPIEHRLPEGMQDAFSVLLGVALIAVAVSANESWSGVMRRAPR
ncbi:hypothetical protein [Nocardioides sp.]|uniref:hypothetical protein n=1 Tax=Nocardioides sp. TaxID=35761 RepID=UPI00286E212F|nr:hypothetical protein [Nocardioides sp.]